MKKFSTGLFALAMAATLTPAVFASGINFQTAINFTCSGQSVAGPGNTSAPPTACTPLTGGNEGLASANPGTPWYQSSISPLTNYYTVTTTAAGSSANLNGTTNANGSLAVAALEYNANQGFNWTNSTGSHASGSSKVPTLSFLSSGTTSQITVADSGGSFYLNGYYLGDSATATLSYEIFGYDGSTLVYCIDSKSSSPCSGSLVSDFVSLGSETDPGGTYYTYVADPDANIAVTSVVIDSRVSNGTEYVDNILVTQTPEPGSLFLLGTGLLGLGALIGRKRAHRS
ncbi:MAG: PEP-CTERM sorting domain-containing protein [Terracidiphilus sp.]|jgi:hypothetical protein